MLTLSPYFATLVLLTNTLTRDFLLVDPPGGSGAPVRSYPFSAPNTGSTIDTTTGIPTIGQSEYRALNPTGSSAVKLLIDGQLYILRDNRLYDIHGREIMSE